MTLDLDTVWTVLLIVAASIWIGGVVTVIVVAFVSARVLDAPTRVEFFRAFGAAHLAVAGPALVVTAVIGWMFLARLEWSSELSRMAFASTLLVVVLVAGVIQARSLTRMRCEAATAPDDAALARSIQVRGRSAAILRGLIVLVTLGLTVHVAALLTTLL